MSEVTKAEKVVPLPGVQNRSMTLWGDQLFDSLPIGIYVCDRDGLLIRYNERAAQLWGRSPTLGDPEQRYCGSIRAWEPDGRPMPFDETPMAEVLRSGEPVVDREIVIERPDGTRITTLANVRPLFAQSGELSGAVNCFQDITCRKRAEERIKESEVRLRELLGGLPAAVYTTDAVGSITFFNEAAAELWGCRPEIGTATWCGSWRLLYPDGATMAHDRCPMAIALTERREMRGAEAMAERPDGTRVPFMAYPTLLHDAAGEVVGAVNMLVDITQRKASEEQLRVLAGEVDHRAKNMLSVIQAVVHLTRADTVGEFKQAIDGRISALARAHTLLSMERWEGADLRRIVEEELASNAGSPAVRVVVDGPRVSVSPQIAQALAMVVHELATNAAKHGAVCHPNGQISVRWWGAAGDRLLFRWSETGCPPSPAPGRKGFGMSIIEGAIRQQLGGTLDWDWRPDGLRCEIDLPLS